MEKQKQKQKQIYFEDETPKDLELVVSNEKGGFVIMQSKKEGSIFTICKEQFMQREEVSLKKLTIERILTPEEIKEVKKK